MQRGACGRLGCPFVKLLEEQQVKEVPTLKEAIALLLEAKKKTGLRPESLLTLKQYLARFSKGRESTPVAAICEHDLEAWFASRNEAPSTQICSRGKLGSLFSFAIRRGWMREHPVRRLEPIRYEPGPPKILTVDQCRTLLNWTHRNRPEYLLHCVLMLLCGLRPTEALRIRPSDFRPDCLVVDAAASKVHRRRIVPLTPQVLEWLPIALGPFRAVKTLRYYHRYSRGCLGVTAWPQDVLRHTYASYAIAVWHAPETVAQWLGNSPRILLRHYRELASREDAAAFFSLLPTA